MIQDTPSADGDKEAEARVDAKRAFVGYFHSLRSATEDPGADAARSPISSADARI